MAKIYSIVECCMSDYADMSYEERLYLSKIAYDAVEQFTGKGDERFIDLMLVYMGVIIRSDGNLRSKGVQLMSDLMPYEKVVLEKYIEKCDDFYRNYSLFEKIKNLIKSMPRDLQEEMLTLGLAVVTIDGRWATYGRKEILKELFDLDDYFESTYRSLSD